MTKGCERSGTSHCGEEKTERGSCQWLEISEVWVLSGWDRALFSSAQQQDKEQRGQTETQEVPSENTKATLHLR